MNRSVKRVNGGNAEQITKGWNAEQITTMVGTASNGLAGIIGSFDWLKKPDTNIINYYGEEKEEEDTTSIILIVAIIAVVAIVLYLLLKK